MKRILNFWSFCLYLWITGTTGLCYRTHLHSAGCEPRASHMLDHRSMSSIPNPVFDLKRAINLTSVGPPDLFFLQWNSWKLCLVLLDLSWPVWYLLYAQIVMEQFHLEPTLATKYPAHVWLWLLSVQGCFSPSSVTMVSQILFHSQARKAGFLLEFYPLCPRPIRRQIFVSNRNCIAPFPSFTCKCVSSFFQASLQVPAFYSLC